MPMREIDLQNTVAFESRESFKGVGPDVDVTAFGAGIIEDLNAAKRLVDQSDYSRFSAEVRAELDKVVFLQLRRERVAQDARLSEVIE